jgi:type 1 glutamine amidotransferase
MFKRSWLIIPSSVFLLSLALITTASCNLAHGPPAATNVTQFSCNVRQISTSTSGSSTEINQCNRRLLVFSKTNGFRHASIKDGKVALQRLAAEHNFRVDFSEDSGVFTDANLAHYDAVIFLMTTGTILGIKQKAAFERYIRAGGGYVGVHSASDTEYSWSWYGGLVGAYFDRIHGHSKVVQATIHVTDRTHPSTMMLPAIWIRTDEWYNFASNPRGKVNVLMTIDERTYKGGTMGADHPIAWYHEYDGGRAWYTALGHTSESYYEPLFLNHLWGGIIYAASGKQRSIASYRVKETQVFEVFILSMPLENEFRTVLKIDHS